VKRQMYGRAKIDLLEARLIGAGWRAPNMRQSQICTPNKRLHRNALRWGTRREVPDLPHQRQRFGRSGVARQQRMAGKIMRHLVILIDTRPGQSSFAREVDCDPWTERSRPDQNDSPSIWFVPGDAGGKVSVEREMNFRGLDPNLACLRGFADTDGHWKGLSCANPRRVFERHAKRDPDASCCICRGESSQVIGCPARALLYRKDDKRHKARIKQT
jgi:hypothetical protein